MKRVVIAEVEERILAIERAIEAEKSTEERALADAAEKARRVFDEECK
jgi:hypothetical protein